MTCFMIGHRYVPAGLRSRMDAEIERHVTVYGVREFAVGHYGHFDAMASAAVREAKKRHPELRLTLLLPDDPYRCAHDPEDYDASIYPEGMEFVPQRAAIVRANRYMVENSDFLICYCTALVGNTRDIVVFALRRAKKGLIRVSNLAEAYL